MDDFMFDPSMNCGLGFDTYNPFSTGLPTPAQMNEAFSHLDPNMDVSGFGLAEWKAYDPLNLDIRNPYVGGYPTLGSDWDPMLDYDPYAPYILENMKILCDSNNAMPLPQVSDVNRFMPGNQMPMIDMNADIMSAGMFPNMPSPEMAHTLGLISDQDYAFLEMIGPKHHDTVDINHIDSEPSLTQQKLDKSNSIERERDTAVEKYNDAKRSGDYDEMLKWETIANDRQQDLYYLWDTPQYGLPAKAPGIN